MHRWNGRIYVVAGVGCVCALLPLQSVVGQGRFKGPSPYMQAMVAASCLLWALFTTKGVLAARRQQYQDHKRWMIRSAAVLSVPVTQRFFIFWFTPLCMLLYRLLYGQRWPSYEGPVTAGEQPQQPSDPVPGEPAISLEGWGRAEIETFGLSAWAGLLANLAVAEYGLRRQAQLAAEAGREKGAGRA